MPFASKRSKEVKNFLSLNTKPNAILPVEDAIALIKKYNDESKIKSKTSVDWSIDVNVHIHLDPGKSVNSSLVLPHGNGKKYKVIAFVTEEEISKVKALGIEKVGYDDLIQEVIAGFTSFDKCIASQAAFPNVSKKLAKILGPKGLLPSVKAGTVSSDLESMVKNVLGGQVSVKASKNGTVATSIARVSFNNDKIVENFKAYISYLKSLKPAGSKSFILKATLSTTMGFGLRVSVA
jgi:large subunit ribosomal protein L1